MNSYSDVERPTMVESIAVEKVLILSSGKDVKKTSPRLKLGRIVYGSAKALLPYSDENN